MSQKLKRYLSLDVLRGLAIIGVFSFHVMNQSYDYNAVMAGDPGIIFYILLVPLVFIGEFDVLFVCLSAIVNTISIDKKWNRIITKWEGDPREGKKHAFWTLIKTQLIRGLFIAVLGYVAEVLLNHMLLYTILREPNIIDESVQMLFRSHILWLIGVGLIVTSLIYLLMKRADWSRKRMIVTFITISVCTLFVVTPLLQWLYPTLGFPNKPQDLWQTTDIGTNILRIILAPFIKDDFPFFPDISIMFVGVIIGFLISKEQVEKRHLNWFFMVSMFLFVVGAAFYFLESTLESTLDSVFIEVEAGIYLMTSGGSILAILIFLYLLDVRRGRKQVKFFYFQRFGIMSLSLWMLQWVMVFPIMLLQLILNAINYGFNWATFVLTRDGPFFNEGLGGYGVIGELIYILAFWTLVLWLWQKIDFIGSFEWITVKLMSGKQGHERARISDAITNVESISDPPKKYYGAGMVILFFVVFLIYCVLYTAITMLL
ncbi:MAG: acyltransferase family protein [Candidatus Lokiarchaeota archaeon]|nr:acyltransferase family protein [Candidatus Lokiarchaeota archaeon]